MCYIDNDREVNDMTQNEKKLILDFINKQLVIAEMAESYSVMMVLHAIRGFVIGVTGGDER